jgi:hypothetical protein
MGSINAKKKWTISLLACQQFFTESHIVARFANERASFMDMTLMTFYFLERLTVIIVVL